MIPSKLETSGFKGLAGQKLCSNQSCTHTHQNGRLTHVAKSLLTSPEKRSFVTFFSLFFLLFSLVFLCFSRAHIISALLFRNTSGLEKEYSSTMPPRVSKIHYYVSFRCATPVQGIQFTVSTSVSHKKQNQSKFHEILKHTRDVH